MIAYRDFVTTAAKGKWHQAATYESFDSAIDAANQWLSSKAVTIIQIETVVLPNIDAPNEEGTSDTNISTVSGWASWHQFLRIWYKNV